MWLRRVPQRTRAQGNTAFGSGCKRFDPKVMIIDWALEPPGAGGPDGAGGPPGQEERARLASAGEQRAPSAEPREWLVQTPGERLRTPHSRRRTPWAAMSYDGASAGAERHKISTADLAALQLRGEVQFTPVERLPEKRQLHSGGLTGWDATSPSYHPAMAVSRQMQRECPTTRQASERPGPAQTARHARTAHAVQQNADGEDRTHQPPSPGYVRKVQVNTSAGTVRPSADRDNAKRDAFSVQPFPGNISMNDGEAAIGSPMSLTDYFNEGNFMPLYEMVRKRHAMHTRVQTQVCACAYMKACTRACVWTHTHTHACKRAQVSPPARQAHHAAGVRGKTTRLLVSPKRLTLSDQIAVEKCSMYTLRQRYVRPVRPARPSAARSARPALPAQLARHALPGLAASVCA